MAIKRPSERNTKTEILSAFDELLKEKKVLEAQLATTVKQPEPVGNGKSILSPEPVAKPIDASRQTMELVIEDLNRLQLNFGGAVNDLSEKLVLEALKLQEIRESVAEESEQLQTLHGLEVADGSLDALIQQYEESSNTFNQELQQRQEDVTQSITLARKAWAKEQEEHRRLTKERNETLSKTRQRTGKEYNYDLGLERKLADEEYALESKGRYQELEELQKTQEKQWSEREMAIRDRETQFAELKAKVEAMPKELEAAMKRTREEGKGIAYQQAKVKADLAVKDVEGNKRAYELRIESLQETIQSQTVQIQSLSRQLEAALKQVQDLAVKAIEGASNVNSFNAVKEIALEHAKNQNKVK